MAGLKYDFMLSQLRVDDSLVIDSDKVYADATARDAALPTPTNGQRCVTGGTLQEYRTDAWVDLTAVLAIDGGSSDVRVIWFHEVEAGTGGTVTPPTGATLVLDQFPEGLDCLVSTMGADDRPDWETPLESGGDPVTGTLDADGDYVLSGTPAAYPVAVVYCYDIPLVQLDPDQVLEEAQLGVPLMTTAEAQAGTSTGRRGVTPLLLVTAVEARMQRAVYTVTVATAPTPDEIGLDRDNGDVQQVTPTASAENLVTEPDDLVDGDSIELRLYAGGGSTITWGDGYEVDADMPDLVTAGHDLVRITRAALADPQVLDDGASQLSSLALTGADDDNTDHGKLWWELSDTAGDRTVSLYKDAAKTSLVAEGSRTGDGAVTLAAQNDSGLSGSVSVAYTADDTGAGNIVRCWVYLVVHCGGIDQS